MNMASVNTKFLEEHQDFVLKLKIKATDGTSQIRRVRLPRVADAKGCISYEELVGLVITFYFPEGSTENYHVSLTYFDVDQDAVTIASTDELVDAIEQYSGKKVLRISTEIRPKSKSSIPQPPSKPASSPSRTHPPRVDRGTSTRDVPVHNVLESFVSVLANAVSTLQEGLAAPLTSTASSTTQTAASTASQERSASESTASSEQRPPETNGTHTSDVNLESPSQAKATVATVETTKNETESTSSSKEAKAEENSNKDKAPKQEERPFIHGRHTCDSCLTTPIVGKRYHAMNLPDYDLCEKCFENYQGSEIKFEPVEADRDKPFQERWSRRRQKMLRTDDEGQSHPGRRFGAGGRRHHGRGRCDGSGSSWQRGPYGLHPPCPPPPHRGHPFPGPHGPPPPFPPPPFGPHGHVPPHPPHSPFGPPPHHHAPFGPPPHAPCGPSHCGTPFHNGWQSFSESQGATGDSTTRDAISEFDMALKLAIRRSLEDVEPRKMVSKPQTKPNVSITPTMSSESLKKAPTGEEITEKNEDKEIVCDKQTLPVAQVVSTEEPKEEPSPPSVTSSQGKASTVAEEDQGDDWLETASATDSETLVAEVELAKSASQECESSSPAPLERNRAEESFASDAIGSGDIAEAMGATFDIVAGVISEMLSEADSHSKKTASSVVSEITTEPETSIVQKQSKDVEKEAEYVIEASDNLILDSVKSAHASDGIVEKEENDWQVVSEHENDFTTEEGRTLKPDEEIARAAEMLGSALFNSDMKSSAEMISTLSAADESYANSFSSATSVPSTVLSMSTGSHVSHVAMAQRIRWASHLEKLRELGFDDESMCVEHLERLEAANIGVDLEDDISVTQVVNAILEQN